MIMATHISTQILDQLQEMFFYDDNKGRWFGKAFYGDNDSLGKISDTIMLSVSCGKEKALFEVQIRRINQGEIE